MKNLNKNSILKVLGILVVIVLVVLIMLFSTGKLGNNISKKSLGASVYGAFVQANNFAILGGSTITNTGNSVITGDLGLSPGTAITGFFGTTENDGPGTISGSVHQTDQIAADAQTALTAAYTDVADQPCTQDLTGQDLGGLTLTSGVYCFSSSAGLTGTLTLNAEGNPNAVFIFKIGSTLTTAGGSTVSFIDNIGSSCNVFWQVGSSAALGSTSNFKGNIFALTSIDTADGTNVIGRLLARNGAVTLINTTVNAPICEGPVTGTLHVTKIVDNTGGGASVPSDFTISVNAFNESQDTSFPGDASGTDVVLDVGAYSVTESGPAGYSSSGDCSGIITDGAISDCTITNTYVPPTPTTLTLTKVIVNVGGGDKTESDFQAKIDGASVPWNTPQTLSAGLHTASEIGLSDYTASVWGGDCATDGTITLVPGVNTCTITNTFIEPVPTSHSSSGSYISPIPPLIDVVKVPNPLALPAGSGSVTYTYTLSNIGRVPVTNITMVDDSCSSVTFISGDTDKDTELDTTEKWIYNCTTTLSKTHTNIVTATGWANNISAVDVASATVVVGLPIVPPLIHVTKIPNPLILPVSGGMVTYTEKITNPGITPLSNIHLTDDKCSPMKYISGDINNDSKLDTNETWTYTCTTNLTKTTTNTASATGESNGITVRDFAIATVVVGVPGLPDTGFTPEKEIALPSRLKIPKLNIDADIQSVGLTSDGRVGVPEGPLGVAWFNLSSIPGEVGSSIIDGHSGYKNNVKAVFDDLDKLNKGDKIYVENEDGTTNTFVVRRIQSYGRNESAPDVFTGDDEFAHLNLITCSGDWDEKAKSHSNRLVVFTDKE